MLTVPSVAGKVRVTSAVAAGPLRVAELVPLSVSSLKTILPAELEDPVSTGATAEFKFTNPLNAEIHELRIWKEYRSIENIVTGSKSSLSQLSGSLLFYVPPWFTKETRTRDVLQTPFQSFRTKTDDPFNVAFSFGVGGKLINLKKIGIKVKVLNEKEIKAIGMNLLFAVGKGSESPSKVVVLEWKGGKRDAKPTALIGKGVVFDSGGLSLKSSSGMVDMAMDMAGAAVVGGVFKSVALSKLKVNIVGLIGLVENMPGPSSMRPGDILKSLKGDMVQVNNTDAEGRLLLGDLLWYAQLQYKPKRIFDLATLTGAIIIALGKEYAGVFSNNDKFCNEFLTVCEKSNEKAWRLPLDQKFGDKLSSSVTDLTNVGGSQGSSIIAAMFLNNFVKKETPWIHLDIAGVAKNTETTFSRNGATAWGVVSLFEYLREFS